MLPAVNIKSEERRRHQRVKVALLGRYMLCDGREYPCQTIDMSPGGVALAAPVVGAPGDRVVAYVDHIGRIEGVLVRPVPNGFAMTIVGTPRKRDKLADQLTWLANRHVLDLPENRRHERIVPMNPRTFIALADGKEIPCRVIDISLSGATVAIDDKPPIDATVTLGRTLGRVLRHVEEGVEVEFTRPQNIDELEAAFGD